MNEHNIPPCQDGREHISAIVETRSSCNRRTQRLLGLKTHKLLRHVSITHHDERRNRFHAIAAGEFGRFVDVDFDNIRAPVKTFLQLVNHWLHQSARAAPVRIKIHQGRPVRIQDLALKGIGINVSSSHGPSPRCSALTRAISFSRPRGPTRLYLRRGARRILTSVEYSALSAAALWELPIFRRNEPLNLFSEVRPSAGIASR